MNDYSIIRAWELGPEYYDLFERAEIIKRRNGGSCINLVLAFDIETTNLKSIEESVMYVWQFGTKDRVVIGRTWQEFQKLMDVLVSIAEERDTKIIIYVHNLSFEFQFLRTVLDFSTDEVFIMKSRKILKAHYRKRIVFRCAYYLSNMSLEQFTTKMDVKHKKLSGDDFDYSVERFSDTPLTDEEIRYCCYDVVGLCEAVEKLLEINEDTLLSIPLTSTGYVRRDAKAAMRQVPRNYVERMLPDKHLYEMLREGFRGGNTHANRYFAGKIWRNVYSADRSSSYPDCQCNGQFPVTPFESLGEVSGIFLSKMIEHEKALIFRASFWKIRLRDEYWGCPYIPLDKTRGATGYINDNGRILKADFLSMTLTDIDFAILEREYVWEKMDVYDMQAASYGKLPPELIAVTIDYYKKKTALKDVPGQEVYYTKNKNMLNSIYGMMAQDPVKDEIELQELEYVVNKVDVEQELFKTRSRQFMPYQWGVWVTANARYELERGIELAGDDFIYTDTDCVKSLAPVDFTEYNKEKIRNSKRSGAFAKDPQGKVHYMGVYETEGCADRFITWGAKKYCVENGGRLAVTVSGVSRKHSEQELKRKGGLEAFKPGMVFHDAGGVEAKYNDHYLKRTRLNGRLLDLYSNVCLLPSTYRLGITSQYEDLLRLVLT